MQTDSIIIAFLFTLFAGLSTGIGSFIAFFKKDVNSRFLSASLGFSAGVMIYISMVEIFVKAKDSLTEVYGDYWGYIYTTISFFAGIGLIAIIDYMIPSIENPHEHKAIKDFESKDPNNKKRLMRMGLFSALAIGIHNFPEGLATFISALHDPSIGIGIAVAIAIHNIPEGIAVSVPVYYATGNRKKALTLSLLSGLSEPIGALVGFFFLMPFLTPALFGVIFALVAGIMVYISLDELLPTAEKYGEHHIAIWPYTL
jgi:ZIP family zinc transporter